MKILTRICFVTLIIGVFSSLLAQNASDNHHLDVHALDALRGEKAKWWAEVQHRMRGSDHRTLKMEMVQYVLSRSFAWKEDDPRDSETRSATLMLAEDVAVALEPILASMPDSKRIVASEEYRSTLLAALNPSHKQTIGTTETPTQETEPMTTALPLAHTKTDEPKPPTTTPSEEPSSSTPWSIFVVMIMAAIGLLWLLLKRRS